MTSEKAYELFVRCFNAGDYTPLRRQLRPNASFSSVDSIYSYETAAQVLENLHDRFGAHCDDRGQAFTGFVLDEGLFGAQLYTPCALITGHARQDVRFLVRMTLKMGKLQKIEFVSPDGWEITRGEALAH
ncbi:MAG: hypothetical protein PHO66_05185 [Eubacteriales bacterium]|nr:hypothetical protein [Eubacteriales bacterium]